MPQSPHFGGLPRFFRCWYRNFPPGVLITRTLLERVLYLLRGRRVNENHDPVQLRSRALRRVGLRIPPALGNCEGQ